MMKFETIQGVGKQNVDAAIKSMGALSKGVQSAAAETADYAKRAYEQCTSTVEKLVGARTLERAIEIQTEYVRSAYEGFVFQAGKIGEIATNTAKDAVAPMEGLVAKTASAS